MRCVAEGHDGFVQTGSKSFLVYKIQYTALIETPSIMWFEFINLFICHLALVRSDTTCLNQHSNQPIKFERQVYSFMSSLDLQPGLGASTSVPSFPSNFRGKLWVGLGLGVETGLRL